MSLIINDKVANGLALGTERKKINKDVIKEDGLFLEYDNKVVQSNSKVLTISKRNLSEFYLNNREILASDIEIFLENENVLIDDLGMYVSYILPEYHLVITMHKGDALFDEVLIYHDSLKSVYENDLPCLDNLHNSKTKLFPDDTVKILPYESVGGVLFGTKIACFDKLLKEKFNPEALMKKCFIEIENKVIRFDKGVLSQILIQLNNDDQINLIYQDIKVNTYEGFNYLKTNFEYYKRNEGRYVFSDLGLTICQNIDEIYIFDKSLLPFWLNDKRPITSW